MRGEPSSHSANSTEDPLKRGPSGSITVGLLSPGNGMHILIDGSPCNDAPDYGDPTYLLGGSFVPRRHTSGGEGVAQRCIAWL